MWRFGDSSFMPPSPRHPECPRRDDIGAGQRMEDTKVKSLRPWSVDVRLVKISQRTVVRGDKQRYEGSSLLVRLVRDEFLE
jgi:hypothetical protein